VNFNVKLPGLCLFLFLQCLQSVRAEDTATGADDAPGRKDAVAGSEMAASPASAYASAMLGNGRVYGGNTSGERTMEGRAVELRFGPEFDLSRLGTSWLLTPGAKMRFDFVHYNEGHPENNHRDGFGAQLVYSRQFNRRLTGEFGVGPYLSMNTTTIAGEEINDSNLGLLTSLALRIGLDQYSPGLHLRIGLNHVSMRRVHSSNALLVGIGKTFDHPPSRAVADTAGSIDPVWIGASVGRSITNHDNAYSANGFSLDVKQYYRGPWAASVSAIFEGDDQVRVDRRGVAVQGWFVQPLSEKWTLSAGLGPYVARNTRASNGTRVHALITLQADRSLSKTVKVFASFSRVKTFEEKNERDLFRIGLTKQFGS
jgi:hypothetical protein